MSSPSGPTIKTIKRLFALSRNRCAYPKCVVQLVHGATIIGEVCHIRGKKEGSPRFDSKQSEEERHSFDNLLLLCSLHHTIVDADIAAYTVERLRSMKREHENALPPIEEPSDAIAQGLQIRIDSVVSHGQSGGITAGVVNILSSPQDGASPTPDVRVRPAYGVPQGWQTPIIEIRIENHSLGTVFLESLVLITERLASYQGALDCLTGEPFYPASLEPGNRRSFHIDPGILGWTPIMAIAIDRIGRRYESTGSAFGVAYLDWATRYARTYA